MQLAWKEKQTKNQTQEDISKYKLINERRGLKYVINLSPVNRLLVLLMF